MHKPSAITRDERATYEEMAIVEKYEAFLNYAYPKIQNCPRKDGIVRDAVLVAILDPVGGFYAAGRSGQPLGGPVAAKPEDLPGAREAAPGEGGEGRGQARLLPETIPGEEPGNETGETVLSEGDQEGSGAARPGLDLTDAEKNAIIAEAYAAAVFPGIAWLEERTGLKGPAIKKRASRAGLGSRERQRASASAFATQQNNDRAVGRSGRSADRTERDDQRAVGRSGRSADRTEQTDERAGA